MRTNTLFLSLIGIALTAFTPFLGADVSVPSLFSDHMVLQRDKPIKVWGWADPGETITVSIEGSSATTEADVSGEWLATLAPMPAGGPYSMHISGSNELIFTDILLGEVWIASGQSNMGFTVNRGTNADLVSLMAKRAPQIRFNKIRNMGSQTPQKETTHVWELTSPESVGRFSAVGYAFAETLYSVLNVPIGIIDNAWGGSTCEAWVARPVIVADPQLNNIQDNWLEIEATYDFEAELVKYEEQLAKWKLKVEEAEAANIDSPRKPRKPQDRMTAQHRPGNLWNGRVLPIAPISARGVIWYQGEGNSQSVERAKQYEHLFSTMILEWRQLWDDEFSFYWVQLADFREESAFGENQTWPFLRNSQTGTMALPKTGQAVITDIGESYDIHPKKKEEVGRRLARWALNKNYGFTDLIHRSPELESWSQEGAKVVVDFSFTGKGLRPFDSKTVHGFVVQSADGEWHVVQGKTRGKKRIILDVDPTMEVQAIGYAWANNPICNLFTVEGLPVTPFRTDQD